MSAMKAIIFDMDGVIVNSAVMYTKVIGKVLTVRGFNFDKAFVAEKIIAHIGKWVDAVLPQNAGERSRVMNEIVEEVKEETAKASDEVVYLEGMDVALSILGKSSILFLITNSGSKLTEKILVKRHLKRFFKEIITADDGFSTKEMAIEQIIKQHGMNNSEVAYVGDTEKDVMCAKTVGCKSVIFYTPFSWNYGKLEAIKKAGPDAITYSVDELVKTLREA
jgi:HAD superfamily hydrolase (TIGR01549 family)